MVLRHLSVVLPKTVNRQLYNSVKLIMPHKVNISGHPFIIYAKISEKNHFLPPDMHTYMYVSKEKE